MRLFTCFLCLFIRRRQSQLSATPDPTKVLPEARSSLSSAGINWGVTAANLHRAYDRGLITITEDYIVRISPTITEVDSPFSLKQFEGKQISLPQQTHHFPSPQNLAWHRKETFRM